MTMLILGEVIVRFSLDRILVLSVDAVDRATNHIVPTS